MKPWLIMVLEDLQERFPAHRFEFKNADEGTGVTLLVDDLPVEGNPGGTQSFEKPIELREMGDHFIKIVNYHLLERRIAASLNDFFPGRVFSWGDGGTDEKPWRGLLRDGESVSGLGYPPGTLDLVWKYPAISVDMLASDLSRSYHMIICRMEETCS